jgi:hypothetical protein
LLLLGYSGPGGFGLITWMQTTGACDDWPTSAGIKRCLRSFMSAVWVPVALCSAARNTDFTDAGPGQLRDNVRVQFDLLPTGLQDAPRGDAVVASSRPLEGRQKDKSKEQEMKRSLVMGATSAGRSLRVLVTSAMLFAALTVTNVIVSPSAALAAMSVRHGHATSVFYTTSGAGTGLANGAEIFAITVSGAKVTTRDVGPTLGGDCGSLALSPHRALYSMCGSLFGKQRLATIDQKTGRAHLFGVRVRGLAVMAMAFGPDGILYAVGDCNPAPMTFECTPGKDPNYNSLYRVNVKTGAFTRIGPTGAPQFFMDLVFDRHGNMLGVTTTLNPSGTPAILYRIDPATGTATKLFNLVGSNLVMGLAFGRNGKLYATDNFQNSGLYVIDTTTGFETAIAALPFGFSSDLVLMN